MDHVSQCVAGVGAERTWPSNASRLRLVVVGWLVLRVLPRGLPCPFGSTKGAHDDRTSRPSALREMDDRVRRLVGGLGVLTSLRVPTQVRSGGSHGIWLLLVLVLLLATFSCAHFVVATLCACLTHSVYSHIRRSRRAPRGRSVSFFTLSPCCMPPVSGSIWCGVTWPAVPDMCKLPGGTAGAAARAPEPHPHLPRGPH